MPSVNVSGEMYEIVEKFKEIRKCETIGEAAMRLLRFGITRYNATANYADGTALPVPEALPRGPVKPAKAKAVKMPATAKEPRPKKKSTKAKGPLARKVKAAKAEKAPRKPRAAKEPEATQVVAAA